jgi:hypothetical protein
MSSVLSAVLGLSFAAGLNTYATVLALGVLARLDVLQLPSGLEVVASTPVMAAAALMYVVEFVADKVPYVDSLWDVIHTVVRPAAGAFLAYGAVGDVDPQWHTVAALVGGGVALTSHTAKTSTRAAANMSPEPFSNWLLSVTEDVIAFGMVWLIATHPYIATGAAIVLVTLAGFIIWKLSRFVRRIFRRAASQS